MVDKNLIDKIIKDLERIPRSRVGNVPKRIKRVVRDLKILRERKTIDNKVLSLANPIDYKFMIELAAGEVYPTTKRAREGVIMIKRELEKEGINHNEDLVIGYRENKYTSSRTEWNPNLEETVKLYVGHIGA